jgi:hypothetical protein
MRNFEFFTLILLHRHIKERVKRLILISILKIFSIASRYRILRVILENPV